MQIRCKQSNKNTKGATTSIHQRAYVHQRAYTSERTTRGCRMLSVTVNNIFYCANVFARLLKSTRILRRNVRAINLRRRPTMMRGSTDEEGPSMVDGRTDRRTGGQTDGQCYRIGRVNNRSSSWRRRHRLRPWHLARELDWQASRNADWPTNRLQ